MDESSLLTSEIRPKICVSSKGKRFTRMDEHYPVTKISRLLSRKEHSRKETVPNHFVSGQLHSSVPTGIMSENQEPNLCPEETATSGSWSEPSNMGNNPIQKFSTSTFKSVRELSLNGENSDYPLSVDMGTALKGLVSHKHNTMPPPFKDSTNVAGDSFFSELPVTSHKIPLDLTLKTKMHLLCSSSVSWFHRLTSSGKMNCMNIYPHGDCQPVTKINPLSPGTFHSWVHPQVSLPREAISALAAAPGDFLDRRHRSWEDSFQNLYYMLRKRLCRIFYVCSSQFVVMFTSSECPNQSKKNFSCRAYISQSTRNLRSLLKQHDVLFSMPLCSSKVEEGTAEDLVELSEMEKHNPGQTWIPEAIPGVDNTPQSLLMFTGSENVHALYDFILNYRFFLTSLTGGDVPVIYSPVPFENAALSAPEVKCKQVRRVGYTPSQKKDSSNLVPETETAAAGVCYSIDIKDAFLPPWVICGICDTIRANGSDYQASFVTEPTSIGLNFVVDTMASKKEDENSQCFEIPNADLSLSKRCAYLKGLKYGDGSYTALLSPIE